METGFENLLFGVEKRKEKRQYPTEALLLYIKGELILDIFIKSCIGDT